MKLLKSVLIVLLLVTTRSYAQKTEGYFDPGFSGDQVIEDKEVTRLLLGSTRYTIL